jgi:hypothetical protein
MKHRSILKRAALLAILAAASVPADSDNAQQRFFGDLEATLRSDYVLCSGDSTHRPLSELIAWRRSIDSIITRTDYPAVVRKFTDETGIHPSQARPCEIVRWQHLRQQKQQEAARFLNDEAAPNGSSPQRFAAPRTGSCRMQPGAV